MQVKFAGEIRQARARGGRAMQWVATAVRLSIFVATVCLVLLAWTLGSVAADASELISKIGVGLMNYPGAPSDHVRRLELNGARISFRTQTVDAPFAEVLDHYETVCDDRDARLSEQLTVLLGEHPYAPKNPGSIFGIATRSNRNSDSGYVACLDLGDEPLSFDVLAHRLTRFLATGNLREAGVMRHAFAQAANDPSGHKTFLLTMWAESEFNLYKMLPREGFDAAGRDPQDLPRPPGLQRVLSAWEATQPSGVAVYRAPTWTEDALLSFYRRELQQRGWTIVEPNSSQSMTVDQVRLLCAERHGRLITFLVSTDEALTPMLTILSSESV